MLTALVRSWKTSHCRPHCHTQWTPSPTAPWTSSRSSFSPLCRPLFSSHHLLRRAATTTSTPSVLSQSDTSPSMASSAPLLSASSTFSSHIDRWDVEAEAEDNIPELPASWSECGLALITCHQSADFDALGSMIGAARLMEVVRHRVERSGSGSDDSGAGVEAVMLWPGSQEPPLNDFVRHHVQNGNLRGLVFSLSEVDVGRVRYIVVVDTASATRVKHIHSLLPPHTLPPTFSQAALASPVSTSPSPRNASGSGRAVEVAVYDHHPPTDLDLRGVSYSCVRQWGSCSAIVALAIRNANRTLAREQTIRLSGFEATCLSLGIYQDTGQFVYAATTPYDFHAAGVLRCWGVDMNLIYDYLHSHVDSHTALNDTEKDILEQMKQSVSVHTLHGKSFVLTECATESNSVHSFSRLVGLFFEYGTVDTPSAPAAPDSDAQLKKQRVAMRSLFAIGRIGDRIFVTGRSRAKSDLDVGRVCRLLGGGGHHCAASATLKELTIPQVKEEIFAHAYSILSPDMTVANIMTSPPVTITSSSSVQDALDLLVRFNLKKLPVMDEKTKQCIGIIDRIAAERVRGHDLGVPCTVVDFMEVRFSILPPDAPIDLAIELILRKHQRVIPIVKPILPNESKGRGEEELATLDTTGQHFPGELIGLVSRSDVIALMMKEPSRFPSIDSPQKNLQGHLKTRLPRQLYDLLCQAGRCADAVNVLVYVVGGFVRDLILDVPNDDIDLVVEGDGIAFAEIISKEMGGIVTTHREFNTATITFPSGLKVDVAMARLEYYPLPVALPVVELSSLKMDLYRRDFTVNAMAIRLNSATFGHLVDFFNSYDDLVHKNIQVLHSLSFVDDPTRIFRAIRFEQRYEGFKITKQTFSLMKSAAGRLQILQKLTGGRLFHEIQKIFSEKNWIRCLDRMHDQKLKILSVIHPRMDDLYARKETTHLLSALENALQMYHLSFSADGKTGETFELWKLRLISFIFHLSKDEIQQLFARLCFPEGTKAKLNSMLSQARSASHALRRLGKDPHCSEVYHLLAPLPMEALLLACALTFESHDCRNHFNLFWSRLQYIKVEAKGADLIKEGMKPGPTFSKIFAEILNARLNGSVSSKEEEVALAKRIWDAEKASENTKQ